MNMAYINLYCFCVNNLISLIFLKFIIDCYHLDVLCIDLTCDNHFCIFFIVYRFKKYLTSDK
jgi:hypothetical protein